VGRRRRGGVTLLGAYGRARIASYRNGLEGSRDGAPRGGALRRLGAGLEAAARGRVAAGARGAALPGRGPGADALPGPAPRDDGGPAREG